MKPVVEKLRNANITVGFYLDDLIIIAESYELLQSLDFIVNFEKSIIIPSKSCTFWVSQ